ncbi:MAG: glycosyltransferase family 2 protein [Nitrososphaeria archaeon]
MLENTYMQSKQEAMLPKVAIIILNWNGWRDTIECLESVFRIDYPNYQVIVCDNNSTDGSMEYIKAWAEGRLDVFIPQSNPLRYLSFPPVPKPIPYIQYQRVEAEAGGFTEDDDKRLILIQNGENLGFAGGNNIGLRYALKKEVEYVWLLNNDTVVEPNALIHMVYRMKQVPRAGICGSTLLYYQHPDKIWALGGTIYNKWLAIPRNIGLSKRLSWPVDLQKIENCMDYVAGASMLVSRAFLKDVGFMSEEYFLYFEELDWAERARGRFTLAYAPYSIVYHKVGSSTDYYNKKLNNKSEYHFYKNKLVFTRKFFPWLLPTVYLGLIVSLFIQIFRRRWSKVWIIIKIIINSFIK